jgi:hypothetical protein
MTRKLVAGILITFVVVSAGALAAGDTGGAASAAKQKKAKRFEIHDLFIEFNASAGDAGLQVNLDGEDWNQLRILDTKRNPLVGVNAVGRLRDFGLTELFFEASEPSFKELPFRKFKRIFPKGTYRFRGRTVDDAKLVGLDKLSHLIPAAPHVTFPTPGAQVDPNGFKVTWDPVTSPAGVQIATYQVIVIQGNRELSMYLPPNVTSATIPGEFLQPGTETQGEVLAREKSGNQTITELPPFRTR